VAILHQLIKSKIRCFNLFRIYTTEVKYDLKRDLASYSRSERLTQLLNDTIKDKKLNTSDMLNILYDFIDLYAAYK